MNKHLAPSIMSADFCRLGDDVRRVRAAGADYLHIDVIDGLFAPQISFGMPVISSLRGAVDSVFDVHLMIVRPERYIAEFAALGADILTVHYEACTHLDRVLGQIREAGAKAAVAINPATPVSVLEWVLDRVDMVLVMTVNPGFGGQKLIPYCLEKVRELNRIRESRGLSFLIEVDGGITPENAPRALEAGADVLVAGSSVFGGDIEARTAAFLELLRVAEDRQ